MNKRCQLALSGVWWFWKFGSGQRCHHRIQKWSFHVFMIFLDFLQDFHTKYWILQKSWRKPKKYKKLRNPCASWLRNPKIEFLCFFIFSLIFFRIPTQNIGFCRNREENQKNIKNWETHVHLDSETQKLSFYVFLYFLWFSSGFPHKILDFAEIVKKTKKNKKLGTHVHLDSETQKLSQLPGNFNGLRAICGKFLLGNYNQPKLMEKQVVETPPNPKA